MILFPMRCFSCNTEISNKYLPYRQLVARYREEALRTSGLTEQQYERECKIGVLTIEDLLAGRECLASNTPEARAMNELGITRLCCRTAFLGSTACNEDELR